MELTTALPGAPRVSAARTSTGYSKVTVHFEGAWRRRKRRQTLASMLLISHLQQRTSGPFLANCRTADPRRAGLATSADFSG